jgi:hypothetical protein
MAAGDWWIHWDNAPVHTDATVKDWMAARQFKVIEHPPYSPDLAPADFFLFPKVKRELAGLTLTKQTFKKEWEGAAKTLKAAGRIRHGIQALDGALRKMCQHRRVLR